jgi:hypothetical protein
MAGSIARRVVRVIEDLRIGVVHVNQRVKSDVIAKHEIARSDVTTAIISTCSVSNYVTITPKPSVDSIVASAY